MDKCIKCKKQIPDQSKFCNHCGTQQKVAKMYRRPDGLYEKILTVNGKRKAFRGQSEKEVMQKILSFNHQSEVGPTFEEVAKEWFDEQLLLFEEEKRSFNTLRSYRPAKDDAVSYFGNRYIKQITPQDCDTYIKQLKKTYPMYKTVANKFSVLHLILDYACVKYNLTANASDKVRIPDNLDRNVRELPPEQEIQIVRENIPPKGTDQYYGWLFIYIALYTGMRRQEIIPARMGETFSLHENLVKVRGASYHMGNKTLEKGTKSKKGIRDIVLMEPLRQALLDGGFTDGSLIFDWHGGLMTDRRLRTILGKYKEWSGVKSTPHQFRHSFITVCFEAGIDLKTTQAMAGHSQANTTLDIYTHLRNNSLEVAHDKLKHVDFATGKIIDQYTENTQKHA